MIRHPRVTLQTVSPEDLLELFEPQQGQILRSIVVFFVTLLVVYGIVRFGVLRPIIRLMTERGVDPSVISLTRLVGQIISAVLAFGLAFTLAGFGSVVTALSAIIGALTIAVGLAANDLIANLLAGLYIINEKLFIVGDWIEWEGNRGRVERIDLRVTRVRTFDNELLSVPNSTLANSTITNPVAYERIRIPVEFDVGYGQVARATELVLEEANRFPEILTEPGPSVVISHVGDTYVTLKGRVWMADPSRSEFNHLRTHFVTNVVRRFAEEGIGRDPSDVRLSGALDIDEPEGHPTSAG